jgi:transposase
VPEAAIDELRELVRLRTRLTQDMVDRVNQLHRLVDLGFPEFTRYLKDLNTDLATSILRQYPTEVAFRALSRKLLAKLSYDGRHRVGEELAQQLIDAAQVSVWQSAHRRSSDRRALRLRGPRDFVAAARH